MDALVRGENLPGSLAWALEYLPEYFSDAPAEFHAELMRDLESGARLIARVAPRGHAKSTCAALAYPLWCLCRRQRRNIIIVTHESSLARQFVRDIRGELENNERLRAMYGDLCGAEPSAETADAPPATDAPPARDPDHEARAKPRRRGAAGKTVGSRKRRTRPKWSEEQFTTSTGLTVQAKGVGASFRGVRVGPQRPDLVICDDIEKDELVESPEGRRKLEHWLRRVVMPALAPDGQLLVLGSLIHYDSLLANLRDRQRFPRWNYKVYRALEAEPDPDGQYRLKALWPARWPVARLVEERERVGTLAFEQEYQANPIDDSVRVFRPEWLRRYDPQALDLRREHLVPLLAVDPATGASGGDYCAIWIGCVDDQTGVIYTRRLILERIGIVEQVKRIVAAFEQYRPVKIGIEAVAYQVALKEILEDYSRRSGAYLPVVGVPALANKRARIEASSLFYENGTFRLPPALDPEVEAQFLHFPKARHDDAPDVCAMGIELARALFASRRTEVLPAGGGGRRRRDGW